MSFYTIEVLARLFVALSSGFIVIAAALLLFGTSGAIVGAYMTVVFLALIFWGPDASSINGVDTPVWDWLRTKIRR